MRFRRESLTFKVAQNVQDQVDTSRESQHEHTYPSMSKTMGTFKLAVEAGSFGNSQIVVMLGQNGTGKTTFIRMLAGLLVIYILFVFEMMITHVELLARVRHATTCP